jgi:hypothetical protein
LLSKESPLDDYINECEEEGETNDDCEETQLEGIIRSYLNHRKIKAADPIDKINDFFHEKRARVIRLSLSPDNNIFC